MTEMHLAAEVARRLDDAGSTTAVELVGDVLQKYFELRDGSDERGIARRVAAALHEDESVVGGIIQMARRVVDPSPEPPDDRKGRDDTPEEDVETITSRLRAAGFTVTTGFVGRVMSCYLALIQAGDETFDDPAARRAAAERIATELGEDPALVRRAVPEVVRVLGNPDRFSDSPETEEEFIAGRAAASTAVADQLRSRGIQAGPDDVVAVMTELIRLTGEAEMPLVPTEQADVLGRVANGTGLPLDLVWLIVAEAGREG